MTLKKQLFCLSSIICTVATLAGFVQFNHARAVSNSLNESLKGARALRTHMECDMMHDALRADVLLALRDSGQGAKNKGDIQASLQEHSEHFEKMLTLNQQTKLDPDVAQALKDITPALKAYLASAHSIVDLAYSNPVAANQQVPAFASAFADLEKKMGSVSDRMEASANTVSSSVSADVASSTTFSLVCAFIIILFSTTSLQLFSSSVTRKANAVIAASDHVADDMIAPLEEALNQLARGDLTHQLQMEVHPIDVSGKDELGRLARSSNTVSERLMRAAAAFNEAQIQLTQLVYRVAQGGRRLVDATSGLDVSASLTEQTSHEIARGAEMLAQSTSESADMLNSLSSAITELSTETQSQLCSLNHAVQLLRESGSSLDGVITEAKDVARAASRGGENVSQTVAAMQRIEVKAVESASQVRLLDRKGEQIGSIVKSIQDIAEQTNLLALNAAIEAARAGENGRGFAVVADEVRKLAEQAAAATREIATLIADVRMTVRAAVDAIDSMNAEVQHGTEQSAETSTSLGHILKSIDRVALQIERVGSDAATASQHIEEITGKAEHTSQLAGRMSAIAKEVTHQADNVAAVSVEAAASAEELNSSTSEVSNSAHEMSLLATDLKDALSGFKIESAKPDLKLAA